MDVKSHYTQNTSHSLLEPVFEEMGDRMYRSHNIIVYGVPESFSRVAESRVKHDSQVAGKLTSAFCKSDNDPGPGPLK